jgi:hypothetical protein
MEISKESRVDLEEERGKETRLQLNGLIREVIGRWGGSSEEVRFPKDLLERSGRIFFEGGNEFTGATKRAIAGVVKGLILSGDAFLAVKVGFSGQLYQVSTIAPVGSSDGKSFIGAFFSPDYLAICYQEGLDPKRTVEDFLLQIFYWDVKSKAEKKERMQQTPVNEGGCWVKVLKRSTKAPPVIYL